MDGGRLYCWKGDNWGHCTTPSVYQQISCVFVWYSIPDCHRFTEAERLETLSISIILWRHWANQKMGIDRPWDSSMSLFGCSLFHLYISSSRRCCSHRSNSSDFLMNTYEKKNWTGQFFYSDKGESAGGSTLQAFHLPILRVPFYNFFLSLRRRLEIESLHFFFFYYVLQ